MYRYTSVDHLLFGGFPVEDAVRIVEKLRCRHQDYEAEAGYRV